MSVTGLAAITSSSAVFSGTSRAAVGKGVREGRPPRRTHRRRRLRPRRRRSADVVAASQSHPRGRLLNATTAPH
eukprot:3316269-Pyramimonas_sp.AAC.1